ncbi:MAG: type II secretion system protein GspJ [Syntrophorhabdales bacterium]|jgi:general secretion pathway protein J
MLRTLRGAKRAADRAVRTGVPGAGPSCRMERGFTLIEILLAVALSALLLTVVYWTYFSINRSIVAATEDQEAFETGRTLSELLKRDIRAINGVKYPLLAKNVEIQGDRFGQLEFVTNALSPTEPQRFRRVQYVLVMTDSEGKVMVRKESTDLDDLIDKPPVDNPPKVFEISRIITGFFVEFYDGAQWVQTWDSGASATLPKQIRATIDVVDTKGDKKRFVAEEAIQSGNQ